MEFVVNFQPICCLWREKITAPPVESGQGCEHRIPMPDLHIHRVRVPMSQRFVSHEPASVQWSMWNTFSCCVEPRVRAATGQQASSTFLTTWIYYLLMLLCFGWMPWPSIPEKYEPSRQDYRVTVNPYLEMPGSIPSCPYLVPDDDCQTISICRENIRFFQKLLQTAVDVFCLCVGHRREWVA